MTFGGTFSEINLDSSIIDVILLTSLIFPTSKLEVSTLNTKWSFLHELDLKEIVNIVREQQVEITFESLTTSF